MTYYWNMKHIKRDKFELIAEKRVSKILNDLRLLGNCSNRNNYEYKQEEVQQMFEVIRNAVKETQKKYEFELQRKKKIEFTFK